MPAPHLAAALAAALLLAACVGPGQYPVTGKECGDADPVLELDARDCTGAPSGSGTF